MSRPPVGESQLTPFRFSFNRSVRLEDRDERLSSDAGALLVRELAEGLDLPALFAGLRDPRRKSQCRHSLRELLLTYLALLA
ncbi:MAG: transposase [Planctomycetes bacterium]|nr:transposase [Planctomycetota bacterium]